MYTVYSVLAVVKQLMSSYWSLNCVILKPSSGTTMSLHCIQSRC